MVIDIITAALIVIPMAIGMVKGAAYVAVRTLGWAGAIIASFFLNPLISGWLDKGPVGKMVYDELEEKFNGPVSTVDTATEGLPQIISGGINDAAQDAADTMVQTIGGLIISVMSFIALVLAVRIIMFIIMRLSSGKKGGGIPVISRVNKLGGLVIGGAEGLLLAFIFLAALIPVMNMASAETAEAIADQLKYSYLAGALYDGNLLTLMIPFGK